MSQQFGFGANTSTDTPEGSVIPVDWPFPDDIYLKDVYYAPADDQGRYDESLTIELVDSKGRELQAKYFNPANDQYNPTKKTSHFGSITKNLVEVIVGEEAASQDVFANTFKEICEKIAQMIKQGNPNYGQVPMRVKILYNNKDFPKLPGYPKVFESARIPWEQSELELKPDYKDRVEAQESDNEGGQQQGEAPLPGTGAEPGDSGSSNGNPFVDGGAPDQGAGPAPGAQ